MRWITIRPRVAFLALLALGGCVDAQFRSSGTPDMGVRRANVVLIQAGLIGHTKLIAEVNRAFPSKRF